MINEKMTIIVADEEKHIKREIPISELIELIYKVVNEKLNSKNQGSIRGEK